MREADAVRRIHIEGLGFGRAVASSCGIPNVADADVSLQLDHVVLLKHISHQTAVLANAQLALARGGDTGCVLTAMLQNRKRIIEALIHGARSNDTDDSAHAAVSPYP